MKVMELEKKLMKERLALKEIRRHLAGASEAWEVSWHVHVCSYSCLFSGIAKSVYLI